MFFFVFNSGYTRVTEYVVGYQLVTMSDSEDVLAKKMLKSSSEGSSKEKYLHTAVKKCVK